MLENYISTIFFIYKYTLYKGVDILDIKILYTDYNKRFTNAEVLLDENNKLKFEIQEEIIQIDDSNDNVNNNDKKQDENGEENIEVNTKEVKEEITYNILLTMVDELGTEIQSKINKDDLLKLILLLQNLGRQI